MSTVMGQRRCLISVAQSFPQRIATEECMQAWNASVHDIDNSYNFVPGDDVTDYDYAANATVELVDSMHRKDLKSLAQGNVMINNQHIILGFGRAEAMVTCRMMGYYCHVKHSYDDNVEV